MREFLLCIAVIGTLAFGFFLMKKLDGFLDENHKPDESDDDKEYPDCVFLSDKLSEEEITAEIKNFRKTHKETQIILCDSGRINLKDRHDRSG